MSEKTGSYTLKLLSGAHTYRIGKQVVSIQVGEPGKPAVFVRTHLPLHKIYRNKFELVPDDSDQLEGCTVVDIPKPIAYKQQKMQMEVRDAEGELVNPSATTGEEDDDQVRQAIEPKAKGKKAKAVEPEEPAEEVAPANKWVLKRSGDEFRIRDTVTNELIESGDDKKELQAKVNEHNAALES